MSAVAAPLSRKVAKVTVAIPSWNGRHHLESCLAALAAQRDPGCDWEVAVFDNGSTDGTAKWIERDHPRVRLIRSERNLGYASACNRLCESSEADAVALLNNDTRPDSAWLRELVRALADGPGDVIAIAGKVLDWSGERVDFAGGVLTFDGHAFQRDLGRRVVSVRIPSSGSEMLFASGSNMLVRRREFLRLGGFDDAYFAYFEDVDFGWRAWAAGWRILFAPSSFVHHRGAATSDRLGNVRRGALLERNAFATAIKNYDEVLWPKMLPLVLMTQVVRAGGHFTASTGSVPLEQGLEGSDPATGGRLASLWRRLLGATARGADPAPAAEAHFRALARLSQEIDRYEEQRKATQARRCRPDSELFERFPLHVVSTYPGDRSWFASETFRRWFPTDLPVRHVDLDDLMRRP